MPWLPILRRSPRNTGAPRFLRQRHPTGWREAAGPPGGTRRPNISQAPAFLLCAACSPSPFNNLLFIPPTRFQRAAYFNASNLFDQIVTIDLCVCACTYRSCQRGPSCVCVCAVCVCACTLSWPVVCCASPAEQCSGLSLLFE